MAALTGASQMPPVLTPSGRVESSVTSSVSKGSTDKSTQPSSTRRFYRRRSRGACEACRGRRIRCDAMTLGAPCTNCTAFSVECIVLQGRAAKKPGKEEGVLKVSRDEPGRENEQELHPMQLLGQQLMQGTIGYSLYAKFMELSYRNAPVNPGKVGYVAEHSNLALLVSEETLHYPIPGNVDDSRTKLARLGKEEVDLLRQRGALLIPHWKFCDDLIESYFQHVAPILPIINRSQFMRQYRDPNNPPSLLLLQTIFLAGSRVTSNAKLKDTDGSTMPCSMTFYKRAKALYDSDYEDDKISTLQALILLGWHSEETGDVTNTASYWNGLATTVAQGSGVHRSTEKSRLPRSDQRLWKRIWWTLFIRDRSMAVGLGRPVHINTNDSDVAMLCEEDFLDDEECYPAEYSPDPAQVKFFIWYVSLCKIMSLVLLHEHPATLNNSRNSDTLAKCDRALVEWIQNCPKETKWESSRHNFWAAFLHCAYYVTVGLRHRAYLPILPSEEDPHKLDVQEHTYPLPFIVFQAACEVTLAAGSMIQANQVQFAPAFMIYALASALNIFTYQMPSETSPLDITLQTRIQTCMNALETLSRAWVAAKIVHARFETILGAKGFRRKAEGALQGAERRHSVEDTTRESISSQYDLTIANHRSHQSIPPQFCEHNSEGAPNPATALTAQNNPTPSSSTYIAFQTMNLLSPARTERNNSTDTTRKGSYPSALLPTMPLISSYGPQTLFPASHPHAKQYEYRHLLAQEKINVPGIPISFASDVTSFPLTEPLQSMPQITVGSAEQTAAAPYSILAYEIRQGHVAMDHLWNTG